MKFQVFECDDYSRPTNYLGVWIANDANHARIIAGEQLNNKNIFETGFYAARELTLEIEQGIQKEIENLQKAINQI